MDFTLNSMTLLGLTLAVGIVIDDAIIVLENIYRYIDEKGVPPMKAAVEATREISLAVLATTISLVIIFVPIAFMTGYARRYVNQFGWTMAMSIMVSMLVAFTLTPSLSARVLKKSRKKPASKHEHKHGFFDRTYVKALNWSLNHRWVVVGICILTFASTFLLNRMVGRDWMPQEDQNELSLWLELPEGSSIDATQKLTLETGPEDRANSWGCSNRLPQSSSSFMNRVNMSFITILLEDPDQRGDINEMGHQSPRHHAGLCLRPSPHQFSRMLWAAMTPSRRFAACSSVRTCSSWRRLRKRSDPARADQSVVDVKANINLSDPEVQVAIDRPRASDLGVRVSDIAGAVRLLMSGEDEISTYKEGSEQYPVTMRLLPGSETTPRLSRCWCRPRSWG